MNVGVIKMSTSYEDQRASDIASRVVERVIRNDDFIEGVKGMVGVAVKESYKSNEFKEAVGGVVKDEVTAVFDNHMSEIKDMFTKIGNTLTSLGKENDEE